MNLEQRTMIRDVAKQLTYNPVNGTKHTLKYVEDNNALIMRARGLMELLTKESGFRKYWDIWTRLYRLESQPDGWDIGLVRPFGFKELWPVDAQGRTTDDVVIQLVSGTGGYHKAARDILSMHSPDVWKIVRARYEVAIKPLFHHLNED